MRLGVEGGEPALTVGPEVGEHLPLEVPARGIQLTRRGAGELGRHLIAWAGQSSSVQLWGAGEIREHYGVSNPTLTRWRSDPQFPEPVAELKAGPVWDQRAVSAWHRFHKRPTGRPRGTNVK